MEIAGHPANIDISESSDIALRNGSSEVFLSEEAIVIRRRKLLVAKKHLIVIEDKIEQLNVMVRRLSPRFHKLQYVIKHRISVFSGLRSVYLKYCNNLQRDINQFLSFQDFTA